MNLQVYIKTFTLIACRTSLLNLIDARKHFWKLDDFNAEIRQEMIVILQKLLKVQKIFTYTCYIASALVYATPFLVKDGSVPHASWIPDGIPHAFETMYILQGFLSPIYVHIVVAFDCIFASICIQVIIQLKLLQNALRDIHFHASLNKEEYMNNIKKCVRHHVFILRYNHHAETNCNNIIDFIVLYFRYIKEVQSYYKLYILLQYVGTIVSMCPQLYIATIK